MENFELVNSIPTPDEYVNLRCSAGWALSNPTAMVNGVNNSLYSILARSGQLTVGMGRIIGDGGMFYLIVDILVLPEYQSKGIGSAIIRQLIDWAGANAPCNSRLWLFAAEGREGFYERLGFERLPASGKGAGMHWIWESG
ncbi:MAG: GNAT family N-acetyltransferase [Syntrophomonas sp.]